MKPDASHSPSVQTIISGGQTGVDRAALDFALDHGFDCGGWIPRGRRTEDGPLPPRYPLTELETPNYKDRTLRNVQDSDGTLILTRGAPTGGTAYTLACAQRHARPFWVVDLDKDVDPLGVRAWLHLNQISRLNVAGPRASKHPDIYHLSNYFLKVVFQRSTTP